MSSKILHNDLSAIQNNMVYLKRPHINNLIEDALQKRVATVVAGAGYGKTQAVYAFLQDYDAIVIWLQLSVFDNIPLRLWENFINSISLQNPELASALVMLGLPETLEAYDKFSLLFSEHTKHNKKHVLIYDDFHLIQEKHVLQFFEKFIYTRIPNLSIVFISREEPAINTVGLFSKGLLSYITEDDLRFSQGDMINYFQMQGIRLSSKSVLDIFNYTGGWIFAIHLVGLSLKKGLSHENYAIDAAKENLFRLIENEVFSVLSTEIQHFLVEISLMDNLPSDLLKELASNNPVLISAISKISSFIRYDAFINTYRIHHLFLSFLSEKQSILKINKKKKIYTKAAQWYEKHGYKMDAIAYYSKVNAYDEIINIAASFPASLDKGVAYYNFILDILADVPQEEYKKNGRLSLLYVHSLLNVGRPDEAMAEAAALKTEYEARPDSNEKNSILCSIYLFFGQVNLITCLFTRKYEHEHFFKKAYDYMPLGNAGIKRTSLSIGPYVCRVGYPDKGDIEKFLKEAENPYGCRVNNGCGYGAYELACSEVAFFRNDLKNAVTFANKAIVKTQEQEQYHMENMTWFYLIRINVSTGNYSKVLNIIDQFKLQIEKQNHSDSYTAFDSALGWFYSAIGQTDKVASWIIDDLNSNSYISPAVFSLDLLTRARYYLAEKKYHEILILLENNENTPIKHFLFGKIEIMILKAVALYYTNEHKSAFETLHSAYDLAYPNSLEMPFIEQGHHMRALLKAAIANSNCMIPKQWMKNVYIKSSTYAKKLAHISSEYMASNNLGSNTKYSLSKREIEVLTDLCHGLTREEIAVNRRLSVNTIKSLLQNIFSKLGAANAIDAVRIATLMKLIE